jgi:hypothetical protein
MVSENRVLRRIFGPKWEEVTVEWRKMHKEELPNLYSLSDITYGYETWSLTLREEHRLRVFENRVLRGISGPKGDEVVGGWRKPHHE